MAEHTPGPWRTFDDEYVETPDGQVFMRYDRAIKDTEAMRAPDARLIAAAPDLLEAARDALRLLDTQTNTQAARVLAAAIAKAEGRER